MITVYPPLGATPGNPTVVTFNGTTALDAFGRLRVSEPYTLFDSQNRYAADNQFDTSTASGGAFAFLPNESSCSMTVNTTSGSEVVRQTFRTFPYQPGKSLLMMGTFTFAAGKVNLRQRVGYFSTQNGCFFMQDGGTGTTLSFTIRTYVSGAVSDVNTVTQANWNGDKLDGTGPSGLLLDVTKTQILFMDFEWLGAGNVRCGFVLNGVFVVAHTFQNANQTGSTAVYMTTAILPIRYEITNTGVTASTSVMKQICSTVLSEGGYAQLTADTVARRTAVLANIDTTFLPMLSIRLNASTLGAVVLIKQINVLPTTTQNYETVLVKNSVLTGASWVTGTFQNVDYDVTATAMTVPTATSIVQSDFGTSTSQGRNVLAGSTGYNFDYQLGASIAGTSDIYTIGIRTVSGATKGDAFASLVFYDLTF
jgi:hypothetical protein